MLSEVRRVCIPIGVWGGFQTGWSYPVIGVHRRGDFHHRLQRHTAFSVGSDTSRPHPLSVAMKKSPVMAS